MKSHKDLLIIILAVIIYIFFMVLSHIGFKNSVTHQGFRNFIYWQIVGNLAGFLSVLVYTYLLTKLPLYLAFALTMGLGQIFVEVFAARIFFKEKITSMQWIGILFIVLGTIMLIKGKNQ